LDDACGLRQLGFVSGDDLIQTRAGIGFDRQSLLDGGDRLGLGPLCGSQPLPQFGTDRHTALSGHGSLLLLAFGIGHRVVYRVGGSPWRTAHPPVNVIRTVVRYARILNAWPAA